MLRTELLNRINFLFVDHPTPSGDYDNVKGDKSHLHPSEHEVTDEQLSQIDSVVGWYQSGYYEGDGFAIVKTTDDKFGQISMSHCSCYGPWDGFKIPTQTWEEMLEQAKRNPKWMEEEKSTWEAATQLFDKQI